MLYHTISLNLETGLKSVLSENSKSLNMVKRGFFGYRSAVFVVWDLHLLGIFYISILFLDVSTSGCKHFLKF